MSIFFLPLSWELGLCKLGHRHASFVVLSSGSGDGNSDVDGDDDDDDDADDDVDDDGDDGDNDESGKN